MEIRDEGLRRALDCVGVKLESERIHDELSLLDRLDWSSDGIGEHDHELFTPVETLDGLQNAKSLRELGLTGNCVQSLAPLADLSNMERLWLRSNALRDVSAVSGMKKLQVADFSSNPKLEDISAIAGATALTLLDVSDTSVQDLSALAELPNLVEVRVDGLSLDEASFETLVELRMGGVKCVGRDELIDAVNAEAARRKLLGSTDDDSVRDALVDAGLDDLAGRWAADGPAATDDLGSNTILHLLAGVDLDDDVRSELANRVVGAGGDPNAVQGSHPHATPLGLAVKEGRPPSYLQTLLELGADPDQSEKRPTLALALEIEDNQTRAAAIETLLAGGADPGHPGAIHAIVQYGDQELVDAAIEAAEDLDAAHDGHTALDLAASKERDDVVSKLLAAGADPNGRGQFGRTPLYEVRRPSTFDLLVEAGADPMLQRSLGDTVLFNYVDIVAKKAPEAAAALIRRAIDAGVDINVRANQGKSVLHVAAGSRAFGDAVAGVADIVRLLLELGANVDALTETGRSALDEANKHPIKSVLKKAKAATGKTTAKRLAKKLDGLANDGEQAWAAARELAAARKSDLLEPVAGLLQERLQALDAPLAESFAAFEPTSEPVVVLLSGGPNGVGAHGTPLTHLVLGQNTFQMTGGKPAKTTAFEALLAAGADPHAIDGRGHSVLREYLYWGEPLKREIVETLLSPETVNAPRTASALHTVASKLGGQDDEKTALLNHITELLVETGADLASADTFLALCRGNRTDLVQRAIVSGAKPDATDGGDNALKAATAANQLETMRYLLELAVDPNLGAPSQTPLHEVRSVEALELLLGGWCFLASASRRLAPEISSLTSVTDSTASVPSDSFDLSTAHPPRKPDKSSRRECKES